MLSTNSCFTNPATEPLPINSETNLAPGKHQQPVQALHSLSWALGYTNLWQAPGFAHYNEFTTESRSYRVQSLKASACFGSAALCWSGLWCGEALGVCLAKGLDCSREVLGNEWQVTRVVVTPHCGGVLRKQLAEVRGVFWKSSLPKTGQGALIKFRERETVLFSLAILLLSVFRSAALSYPG